MTLATGTRIGSYEILGPLGAGGMGEVYRARDLRLGREIAIKVLPAGVASSPDRLARFEREARTVAGLNHPSIVTLYSVEDKGGVRFLTMELVEGQTLSTFVAPGGLPLPRLLELAIPLTDALVAAHERGVIHRDLKPGNVMVTRDGRVKVLDFGLAKMTGADSPASDATIAATAQTPISGEGQVVGTAHYMAPEQLRGEIVDARSDLFSLGILLYELASGGRPFAGESAAEVTSSILRDTPRPLSRIRTDLPAEFGEIVSRCLEKNPRQRIQAALDVNNSLRRLRKALERREVEPPEPDKVASIAVLPFANRSASADDEYFSDGLADELLNVLSKIQGLRVSARTSSFTFKEQRATIAEIGRVLNVAAVLEGSVRKAGNRVRISVQLVKVADGYHIWAETYDRTLDDIFAVQDDIAQSVVKGLRTALLGQEADSDASGEAKAEVARAAKGRGTDPEAHRLFLLARHLLGLWTREDTARAIEYLEQAVKRDPEFALAWSELARALGTEAGQGWTPVAEAFDRAREAAQHALALEPDLAEGHARLGWIRMNYDWDWRGAEASFARALELAPGSASTLIGAGALAANLGRSEEGIDLYRRALEQDPLSGACHNNIGLLLLTAGRFAEAEAEFRKALELAPQRISMHAHIAFCLFAQRRDAEALDEAGREPEESLRLYAQAVVLHGMGREAESEAALRELAGRYADTMAVQIAEVHAVRGEVDRAFEWLERAYEQRDGGLTEMKVSPRFLSLHGDPRWGAFLEKMGLKV